MNFIEATYILRSKKDKGPDYINRFLESISIFNGKNLTDKKYLPQLVETDIFYDESRKIYEYIFKIGFPIVLFEHNISSIISILRKVTAHSGEDEIVIVNIDIPSCYTDHFSGPKYGTDRIKRILEIEHEPVIAGHIFPFVGVGPEVYVDLFEKLAVNGVDIVIEDTSFIDDRLIPFDKRVELCLKKAEQIEKDTGRKIIYIPVLTGSVGEVFEKARFAESIGIHGFHIDIDPYGMEFLRSLSDGTEGILAVSGSVFSNRYLEGQVFVKLLRLSGADILNIPSPFNENRYTLSRVYELIREATDRWENIKPVFPMLSGYTKPSDIPDIYREFGNQVIINIEESYYNHPEGLQAGVRAFREALDCVIKGISLDECRKKSRDLDLALSKWGESLKDPAVFSDFDGTITQRDVIISIMEQFAPEEWKKIHSDLMTGVIDVDLGIKKMFNLIPSEKKDEIVQWCKENVKLRDGFEDFLLFLKKRNIPFIILSGGVDFYIYPIMEPYMDLITKIYSNRGIFSGNYIDVDFIYKCNSLCKRHCGICKPYILKNYKDKNSLIYIGDGITDLDGALYSDIIFATGYLVDYLQKLHIKYNEYYNFYDIKIKLQRLL